MTPTVVDVLIVGSGPAGLTAAVELRRLGLAVLVVEREQQPGGIPRHTEHLGYGMRDLHRVLSGPSYARRLAERAVAAGVELRCGATVLDVSGTHDAVAERHTVADLHTASGIEQVAARAVVLATGVRERPRAARLVPGDRPAGVLTTGALQQSWALHRQRVGRRAVIVGAEHVSCSAVLTLRHAGCEVAAMVTPFDRHQTYAPLRWATATRHRVPIRTGVDVARIVGRRRVEAVELTDGSRIDCDTIVFTGDWVPDHELAVRGGCAMVPVARAPLVDTGFRTTVSGVFAVGNLVHPAETADVCALAGRAVGEHVAAWIADGAWQAPTAPIAVAPPIRWATVSGRRITLRTSAFAAGRLQLTAGGRVVATSRSRRLVPNRSMSIQLPPDVSPDPGALAIELVPDEP